MEDPFETFDLLSFEAEMFAYATERMEQATSRTGEVEALTSALDHAFAAIELVGQLRAFDYDKAESLSETWRQIVLEIHREERRILDSAWPCGGG